MCSTKGVDKMIRNLPTHEDFLERAESFFHLAMDSMIQLSHIIFEMGYDAEDEMTEDYWKACQPKISNAVILTQQALEFGLKAKICETSPFLLLNLSRDFPKKSQIEDKEFAEFKTIDANDLINYVATFSPKPISEELKTLFESTRILRNSLIHTVDKKIVLLEKDIYRKILSGFSLIFGDCLWLSRRFDYHQNSEKSVLYSETSEVDFYTELSILSEFLVDSEWKRYFGVSKKTRRYICQSCANSTRDFLMDDDVPRWAVLEPNTPTATTVSCLGCGNSEDVIRKKCPESGCKGNVLDDASGLCLTCNN